ncbi:MAG: hypothetical protein LBB83_12100 [Treponema sp.]|jgi:hypothetical protein|nr:hypothetical protein [Treponema sp.]
MKVREGYIIDRDISKYADRRSDDTIPRESLRGIPGQRVSGGVIQRAIGKWLNAGVMEQGNVEYQEKGRPQGGTGKGKGSYTFPGFTHYWMKSKKGRWIVGRKTGKKRLRGSIQAITGWCRENRLKPVKEQHEKLTGTLRILRHNIQLQKP